MSEDEYEFIYSSSQYKQMQAQTQQQEQQILNKSQQLKEVQNLNLLLTQENKDLIQQLQKIKELGQVKQKRIEEYQREVDDYKSLLDQRDLQLVKVLNEKAQIYDAQIKMSDTFIQDKAQERERHLLQQNLLEQTNQSLIQERDLALKELKQLKESLKKVESVNYDQKRIVDAKEKEIEKLKKNEDSLKKQISLITTVSETFKNESQGSNRAEFQSMIDNLNTFKQENAVLVANIQTLQAQRNQERNDRKQLEAKLSDLMKDISVLEKQVEEQNKRLNIQSQFVSVHSAPEFDGLKNKCRLQELQIGQLTTSIKDCNDMIKQLKMENEALLKKQENPEVIQLREEVKSLSKTLYESSLNVIFALLEYRLQQQLQGEPKQSTQKQVKEYWRNCLEEWKKCLKELENHFKTCGIQFSYLLQK